MVLVYVALEVEQVLALHPYLNDAEFRKLSIVEQLKMQADTLRIAHVNGDRRIAMQVRSWWPKAANKSLDDIMIGTFTQSDAALTICREYGFSNWNSVQSLGDLAPEPEFEQAQNIMLAGEIDQFEQHLISTPHLATAQARYGHQATLLHYLGANGVESHRQMTPLNAAELAQILISMGASKQALANMYGGGQTPLALASTSAHPYKAGISDALNRVLQPD